MKQFLVPVLRRAASVLGYELLPVAPVDMRDITDDPVEAMYMARKRSFVINVPVNLCRSWLGFNLADHLHPYVRTAYAYLQNPEMTYEESPLKQYYDHFRPGNAAEVLGLTQGNLTFFESIPVSWRIYPWNPRDPEKVAASKRKIIEKENYSRGLALDASHGYTVYGPVSVQKGMLELSALVNLVNSISGNGYVRTNKPDGDIQAILAFDTNDDVRFFIGKGHHRAAVLAALGHRKIPVRLNRNMMLRKNDASRWPHVRDGMFSLDQAIEIFEYRFAGQPPKAAIPPEWIDTYKVSIAT